MKQLTIFFTAIFLSFNCNNTRQTIQVEPPFVFDYPKTITSWRMPLNFEKLVSPFLSITAVGDMMLGNFTSHYIQKFGVDYPFDSTRLVLSETHLTLGNLEAPFTKTGTQFEKTFTFKVPPAYCQSLVNAGFDVVTLANNHILDYGIEGLKNTLATLDSFGISHCGAGLDLAQAKKPAIIERNGFRVAFLGYSLTFPEEFWATRSHGGTCFPSEKILKSSIQQCDSLADITVVTFHWGAELMTSPKEYQKQLAHKSIDWGADLVIGHHPHVLQGLEIYKNRLIAYSLGNFTFSSYSRKTTESAILKVFLTRDGLLYAKVIPVCVNNEKVNFQPRILFGAEAEAVITQLRKFSEPLNSHTIIDSLGYVWNDWNSELQKQKSLVADSLVSQ